LTLARHRFAMKLSQQMQRVVREQRLGFVATVTPDGRPNLSPKGTTKLWDDERLFFADIASPGTVANLATNPHVEINVVDPILRKGFRFKGTAAVYTSGEMYDRGLQILRDQGSTATSERVRSIVVIDVTEAAELVSPAYDDEATEQAISDSWLGHYTELHRALSCRAIGGTDAE
jgi:predicted pyridoxine 5'-phosphate oxidase superfamily flavin-nucleotide-binding protein